MIGIDNHHLTYPVKVAKGTVGEPIATKTRLGWVIGGNLSLSMIVRYRPTCRSQATRIRAAPGCGSGIFGGRSVPQTLVLHCGSQ
uniref:Peptidase aspartic putative domain-containing protein n=1 Tax=Anopheles albimanus TaxID=7167 RepID=A0A182FT80_ANOAL